LTHSALGPERVLFPASGRAVGSYALVSAPRKLFLIAASLGECAYLTAVVFSVIVFLCPIQQFICFRF